MRSRVILAVMEKELIDLLRDIRAIALSILLPILSIIIIMGVSALLYEEQRATIAVQLEERGQYAERLIAAIEAEIEGSGISLEILEAGRTVRADVYVIIPKGFEENLSRLDGQARISVSRLPTSAAAEAAYGAVISAVQREQERIVKERVERLSSLAGVPVSPGSLLSPLTFTASYHLASGEEARPQTSAAALLFRLSILFMLYPPMGFVSDAIIGERERRTIERLLAAPVRREELLVGKIAVGLILGLISLFASAAILVALPALVRGITAPASLVLVWLLSAIGLTLFSASIAAAISSISESARSSQMLAAVVATITVLVYTSSLLVDFSKTSPGVAALAYLLAPIHSSMAIQRAAAGETLEAAAHLAILYALSAAALLAAARIFRSERLLLLKG